MSKRRPLAQGDPNMRRTAREGPTYTPRAYKGLQSGAKMSLKTSQERPKRRPREPKMRSKSEKVTTCGQDGSRHPFREAKRSDHPSFWAPFWEPKSIKIVFKFIIVFYIRFGMHFSRSGSILELFWESFWRPTPVPGGPPEQEGELAKLIVSLQ